MADDLHKVTLSSEEVFCLQKAVLGNEMNLAIIDSSEGGFGGGLILELDLKLSEELRDCLTEQLAKTGFSDDYSLTHEGEILESLIDKFYIA